MSDNLGQNQTRVLDTENRNFEVVVYQRKKPPLSCEVDLTGKIARGHQEEMTRLVIPSGWAIVGNIKDDITESLCYAGDAVCSSSYDVNTFKLIALDKGTEKQSLVAWVNGWKIVVQGTDSIGDENNIIILGNPPSIDYRVDFIFLEIWRKLITPNDVIYKHGNYLYGGINPSNDLIDPAINIETSLRIQTQYRIRIAATDIEHYPDGFDPNQVFVQGPNDAPITTCSHAYFSPVPGDPGLWRAGVGDSAAQETLGTVDGYTYAIPMFVVHRRNSSSLGYDPDSRSNAAGKSLADYLVGQPSDRPDNRYNNWVVADDILDMRHRIIPVNNMKEICESSFQKLTDGKLRGKLEKVTLGEDHFGKILVQADAVSSVDKGGSTRIASGDGIRRVFSNAQVTQPNSLIVKTVNDKIIGTPGAVWAASDAVQVSVTNYPANSYIISVEDVYTVNGSVPEDASGITISGTGTNTVTVAISSSSSLIGTSLSLTIDYTINLALGPNGLTRLPETFLEFREEDSTSSIASQDADIRVRISDPVIANDGTHFNMLSNKGGNITEPYNFGHQMIYHALGNGTLTTIVPRSLYGYNILGIANAKIEGDSTQLASITRTSSVYNANWGSIVAVGKDIELALYTGEKYFETNKQGRAIIDTFEMDELRPIEAVTGGLTTFHIDSTNRAILGLASNIWNEGIGYAYIDGTQTNLTTNNIGLPTDTTKSRATIDFATPPVLGSSIEVPVMMKSAIESAEGYTFFYHAVPYQGLDSTDSTTVGVIEAIGPAIITTAGSGAITDTTYSDGKAYFSDSTIVTGIGTRWLAGVQTGFVIRSDGTTPTKEFIISEVQDNDALLITGKPDFVSDTTNGEDYTIIGKDQPSFNRANIIDRLLIYDNDSDSSGKSENIATAISDSFPVLETRIISKVQDIVNLPPNTVIYGTDNAARGRSQINIPGAPLGLGNLGLKFEKLDSTGFYQKTYQAYILNKDNDGRLYLLVVGSETDKSSTSRLFNENYNLDTVDIFEMPGRPLTNKRTE